MKFLSLFCPHLGIKAVSILLVILKKVYPCVVEKAQWVKTWLHKREFRSPSMVSYFAFCRCDKRPTKATLGKTGCISAYRSQPAI